MKLAIGEPLPPSGASPTKADQATSPSTHSGPMTGPHDPLNMSPEVKK
jgi:hypothetical protein